MRDQGNLEEAETSARKAIKLNPNFVNAHANLGNILRDQGKLEEAMLCTKKIMSIRSWSILGSYCFNYHLKSNSFHNS